MINDESHQRNLEYINYEINLDDIIYHEFRWDGQQYINNLWPSYEKPLSPYYEEIVARIIRQAGIWMLEQSVSEFKKDRNIDDLNTFLNEPANWDRFYVQQGFVYPLRPTRIVTPSEDRGIPYKFFLPFRLKHVETENITEVLYFHRDKYYQNKHDAFYWITRSILKEKKNGFWRNQIYVELISEWLAVNDKKNIIENKSYYYFEIDKKFNQKRRTYLISNLYDELTYDQNNYLSKKDITLPEFRKLFRPIDLHEDYIKMNWLKKKRELKYFIDKLHDNILSYHKNIWVITSHRFLFENNSINRTNLRTNHSITQEEKKKIDSIFSSLI